MAGLILKRPSPLAYPSGAAAVSASHPASVDLLISTVARAGSHLNLLKGASGAIVGTPARKLDGNLGDAVNFPGATDRINFASFPTTAFNTSTTAAIFRLNVGAIVANPIDICGDSNGSNAGMGIGIENTIMAFTVRFGAQFFVLGGPMPACVPGVPYFMAASGKGANKINVVVCRLDTGQFWTNTVAVATGAGAAGTGTFVVGGRDSTSGRNINGSVACTMRSTAFMSIPQLIAWAQDPWSFWYPQKLDLWGMIKATVAGGGSTTNKTVTAVCTSTSTLIRRTAKTVAATCTSISNLIRRTAKTLAATCTTTALITALKAFLRTLTATCTTTLTGTASKAFLRALTATCTTTASLVTRNGYGRLLVATATTSASVIRSTAKKLAATCTSTASVLRGIAKKLTALCTTTLVGTAFAGTVYVKNLFATITTTSLVNTVKALYAAVLTSATLSSYKPAPFPTLPGSDPRYILSELQRIATAMEVHNKVTKDLDERLTAAGF